MSILQRRMPRTTMRAPCLGNVSSFLLPLRGGQDRTSAAKLQGQVGQVGEAGVRGNWQAHARLEGRGLQETAR